MNYKKALTGLSIASVALTPVLTPVAAYAQSAPIQIEVAGVQLTPEGQRSVCTFLTTGDNVQVCYVPLPTVVNPSGTAEVAGVQFDPNAPAPIEIEVAGVQLTPQGPVSICSFNLQGGSTQVCYVPLPSNVAAS